MSAENVELCPEAPPAESQPSNVVAHPALAQQQAAQERTAPRWTKERMHLVRAKVPLGTTDEEFAIFIEVCRRSGMDPLLNEIYCVPRRKKVVQRGDETWVVTHEPQPSEAGMLSRAERFPDYRGIQAGAVYSEDPLILINPPKGIVEHEFNPAKRKGTLIGAYARVEREGRTPTVVWLNLNGYKQPSPLWGKIPENMIEKCARVAALRKAYPEAFGGLYIREEMPVEEFDVSGRAARGGKGQPKPTRKEWLASLSNRLLAVGHTKESIAEFYAQASGADPRKWGEWTRAECNAVAEAVKREVEARKAAASGSAPSTTPEAQSEAAPASAEQQAAPGSGEGATASQEGTAAAEESTATPSTEGAPGAESGEEPPTTEVPAGELPATPEEAKGAGPAASSAQAPVSEAVVAFGPYKGWGTSELSDEALEATILLAQTKLLEQPKARWAAAMRENLTALERVRASRQQPAASAA